MTDKANKEPIRCRDDIQSLHSWSELAHDTLLTSGLTEKSECKTKYKTGISELSETQEEDESGIHSDHNGFSKTRNNEDFDDSDDDNIFFISSPDMGFHSDVDLDSELEDNRDYTSLPNFSSLHLDSTEKVDLCVNSPCSLPFDYKEVVQQKSVYVCNKCNKVCTQNQLCSCQQKKDSVSTRKNESHLKDLFKSKSPSKHIFKPKGINFHGRKHFPRNVTAPDFVLGSDESEQSDKVKNKIMSVWNNVKYGWTLKTKTTFLCDSPIFVLGRCYHRRPEDADPEPGEITHTPPSMHLFRQDFESRLWFTYRRDFTPISSKKLSTDCGWGCMLRSGQMMLAEAFIFHFLGRDWRVYSQTREQETFYRHIIQWFGDSASDQCPFSIHRLVELGKVYGKHAGDWYGPSSVAYIFRDALSKANMSQPVLKNLCLYVAQDCTVYKQDIHDMCTARPRTLTGSEDDSHSSHDNKTHCAGSSQDYAHKEWYKSVIILIPVRLGGEEFNPIYSDCIKNLMAQEGCLGIIGGKPKHSLYFIGWQGNKLIYMDPHYCQDHVDVLKRDFKIQLQEIIEENPMTGLCFTSELIQKGKFNKHPEIIIVPSFHCFTPRKISIGKMDPSGTLGFYCKSRADFERLIDQTEQMIKPAKGGGPYPMFVFSEGKGSKLNAADFDDLTISEDRVLRVRHVRVDENGQRIGSVTESEEFIVL